jgi:hypothetical protein
MRGILFVEAGARLRKLRNGYVKQTNKQVMLLLLFNFYMFVCHVFFLSYLVVAILISCSAYSLSDELQMFSIARPSHLNIFKFSVFFLNLIPHLKTANFFRHGPNVSSISKILVGHQGDRNQWQTALQGRDLDRAGFAERK